MTTNSPYRWFWSLSLVILAGCSGFSGREFAANLSGLTDENEEGCYFFAPDILALPGRRIALQARISNVIGDKPLNGVHVEFLQASGRKTLGQAITDTQGLAEISWTPPGVGDYDLEVKITKVPNHLDEDLFELSPTFMLVCIRPAEEPFMVIDLDRTLVKDNFLKVCQVLI